MGLCGKLHSLGKRRSKIYFFWKIGGNGVGMNTMQCDNKHCRYFHKKNIFKRHTHFTIANQETIHGSDETCVLDVVAHSDKNISRDVNKAPDLEV